MAKRIALLNANVIVIVAVKFEKIAKKRKLEQLHKNKHNYSAKVSLSSTIKILLFIDNKMNLGLKHVNRLCANYFVLDAPQFAHLFFSTLKKKKQTVAPDISIERSHSWTTKQQFEWESGLEKSHTTQPTPLFCHFHTPPPFLSRLPCWWLWRKQKRRQMRESKILGKTFTSLTEM